MWAWLTDLFLKKTIVFVFPGVFDEKASFEPTRELMRVDFPAFERPKKAMQVSHSLTFLHSKSLGIAISKSYSNVDFQNLSIHMLKSRLG